ncbi:hypothetical protein ACFVT1_13250 [Streptomyces sp. NPDC057963]|uniref:hypothetical protein n=1 Tax=Streptomyces sp. NPDC057963 TaxID=3346290 RepID=UPI0036E659CD
MGTGRLVGDELLLNGRAFGDDHDDPNTPLPRRTYAELVGGLLDGLLLNITAGGPRKSTTASP